MDAAEPKEILSRYMDDQRRFDAHIEVYGPTRSMRVQYETPYIRHLPTTLVIRESCGSKILQEGAKS